MKKIDEMETESIIKHCKCGPCRLYDEVMRVHRSAGMFGGPVKWHKERLGHQAFMWFNGEHKMYVWQDPEYRVFVNDNKGICFEYRSDLTREQALSAWRRYMEVMGVE